MFAKFVFSRLFSDRGRSFLLARVLRNYYQEKTRHFTRLWPRPKATRPPLLLCGGVVVFVWDEERISNEQITSCVADYLEHVSSTLPISVTKDVGEADSFAVPTPSPSTSSTTSSSSWGMLNWFLKPSSEDIPKAGSNAKVCRDYERTSYISWTLGWLPWLKPATPASGMEGRETPEALADGNSLSAESIENEQENELIKIERVRKTEFSRALRHHLKTCSEQKMSQLPLVGMVHRDGRRGLISGPRLIEHMYDMTKSKVLKFCDENLTPASQLSGDHHLEHSSGSSESDLACIEESLHSCHQSQRDDLYKLYMMVDWGTRPVEISDPSQNSDTKRHDVENRLIPRLIRLKLLLESMKMLLSLNLDYFREELLFEAHTDGFDPAVVHGALRDAADASKDLYSRLVKYSQSKTKANRNYPGRRISEEVLTSSLTLDQPSLTQCLDINAFRSIGLHHKRSMELSVITGELAKIVSSGLAGSVYDDSTPKKDISGHLLGWECITRGYNHVAYRKLYKDTGLFQYKVIGHFDDITAQDFRDVQVNHSLRKDWDKLASNLVVVDSDYQSNCKLIHWIMKYPFPMLSREYLFVQRAWTSDNNDIIVIMNRTTSHPSVEETGKHVRVRDYFSDMVIKACSSVDKPGMQFELTYFDNPRTNLPSSCIDWVTFSALPDFMSKLHAAAYSKQNKMAS